MLFRLAFLMLVLGLGCRSVSGQTTVYYRVLSTQQTMIIDRRNDGTITWTNTYSDSTCKLVQSFWLDGYWTTNFLSTNLVSTGLVYSSEVQIPQQASLEKQCHHNLNLIWVAMQKYKEMYERECFEDVTLGDLIGAGLLSDPPPYCPDGGTYALTVICAYPTCSTHGFEEWEFKEN